MFDTKLMLRDGATAGALATTGTSAGVGIWKTPVAGLAITAIVPAAFTTTTLDITIQHASVDANASYSDLASFPQITAAGIYSIRVASPKRYLRGKYAVAGTTPNFGAVSIGVVPTQDRFWNV